MTLRNTSTAYGSVAKALHWLVALFVLVDYISVYFKYWFTEDGSMVNMLALHVHVAVGVSVGGVVALRVLWRLTSCVPAPLIEHKLELLTAKIAHAALYFLMIAMPLTGYLFSKTVPDFGLFTLPVFGETGLGQWLVNDMGLALNEDIRNPMRTLHRDIGGRYVFWILILVHVAAALYHHFVRRNNTLVRMLPGKR